MASAEFQAVLRAFAEAGWNCRPVEGQEVAEADFEMHHTRLHLHVQAFAEIHAISVVVQSANPVSRAKCAKLAELLMRANETLTVGAFELLWDDGLALFRHTNLFGNARAQPAVVLGLMHSALAEMDRLTPLIAILEGTPEAEIDGLDTTRMLRREDLLPPTGAESGLVLGE